MGRSTKRASSRLIRIAAGAALALLATSGAEAKPGHDGGEGWSHHVSAVVVNPAGLESADMKVKIELVESEDADEALDGIVGAVKVTSTEEGTHWVHLPLSLPSATHSGKGRAHDLFVTGVEICHVEEEANAGAPSPFITRLRLSEVGGAMAGTVVHDDETDQASEEPTCFQSDVGVPFTPEGALTLSLNLSFAEVGDMFRFGAIRILLTPRPDRARPSGPSEPSRPSEPSGDRGRDD